MNHSLCRTILCLAWLFAASEAAQQTNSEAMNLLVILHMETAYRAVAIHTLSDLAMIIQDYCSLAVHVVTETGENTIFPASTPPCIDRDKLREVLNNYTEYTELPAGHIFTGKTLMKIITTYSDSCPEKSRTAILTSELYDQEFWAGSSITNFTVVQLRKDSSSSWREIVPNNVHYIDDGKLPEVRRLFKTIFNDSMQEHHTKKCVSICTPQTKDPKDGQCPYCKYSASSLIWMFLLGLVIGLLFCCAAIRRKTIKRMITNVAAKVRRNKSPTTNNDDTEMSELSPLLDKKDYTSSFYPDEIDLCTSSRMFHGSSRKNYTSTSVFYGELEKTQWKDSHWIQNQYDELKKAIPKITFSPDEIGVTEGEIVLIGPVGHGKSSFINSVISIAKGSIEKVAPDGASEGSMKLAYNKFVCDNLLVTETMVITPTDEQVHITSLLTMDLEEKLKANPNLSIDDKVRCVIFCLKATELANMDPKLKWKIQALRAIVDGFEIPKIMILTNIDNLCAHVKEDVTKPFDSFTVRKAVELASETFEIKEMYIHPVQNFTRETYPEPMKSILLLTALQQVMKFCRLHFLRRTAPKLNPSVMNLISIGNPRR